ncbi:MAG: hypothetical protein RIB46_10660 [Pseudomonadales bacterium]
MASLLLAGCAALSGPAAPFRDHLARSDQVGECARLLQRMDAAIDRAGVADAQYARIPGFPYLRIDRYLAATTPTGIGPRIDALRALDREARALELANLPSALQGPDWPARADDCARTLRAHDLTDARLPDRLRDAQVPDAYRTAARIAGLYPLTSVPFLAGVRSLHRDTADTFATPLAELAVAGQLRRFGPSPPPADGADLWHAHAPVWEIDVASAADRPGTVALSGRDRSHVSGAPSVYVYESRAHWYGQSLRQLNYVIWFPARPSTGPLDLLGGHLDGITWRVTLDDGGAPLIYDAMHNCGCYHQVFPTSRVRLLRRKVGREEPIMVPQQVSAQARGVVIRVAAGSHYLQRVMPIGDDAGADGRYEFRHYDTLRSLPLPGGGRHSLFAEDGLVPGTSRRERWLFWPMGVPSAGAMRQRGHHAIAFVGRRHFDDPDLLMRYFAPAD